MSFIYSPYIFPLIISALISSGVAIYAWTRRATSSAIALALLGLAIAEWSLGYALEIAGADLSTKLIWGKLQYLGIATAPLFWLIFAYNHANQGNRLTHQRMFLLASVPAITIILAFTTGMHGLIWKEFSILAHQNFSVLEVSHGLWFWVHTVYSYILLAAGIYIVFRSIGRMEGLYRGQTAALIIAVLVPWLGNALYLSGLSPIPNLDITPFAFTITVVGLAWGIFGFQLVSISPVAREMVIETMREGMIVLDRRNQIADINPAAARMIGVPVAQAIGKSVGEALSPWPHLLERFRSVSEINEVITVGQGESQRSYGVRISPLQDQQKRLVGRVITVRDVDESFLPEPRFAVREPVTRPLENKLSDETGGNSIASKNLVWGWLTSFFTPPLKKDIPVPQDVNPAWAQTIERAITIILRIGASAGTLALLAFAFPHTVLPVAFFSTLAVILGVIWLLALARNLPFRLRVNAFLFMIYALAFTEMLNFGYSAESFAFFLSFIVLAALLTDFRHGLWTLAIALLTMGILGWLIGARWMIPLEVSPGNSIVPENVRWGITSLIAFSASAFGLVAAINTLLQSLNRAWQKETQALNLLQQERDLLEQRIIERTRDLATVRDEAVQNSNELRKYFLAMEQSGNTIVITDTKGNIEYANPKFEALTGYTRAETLGKNPRILKSGEHDQAYYKSLWDTISSGKIWYGEFHNRRKDGSLFWEMETIAPVFDENGQIINYVAVKENITAQKELQEALAISRDQALEASHLKSQLLSRVSHELRTPLGTILGYAELLTMRVFGDLKTEQKDVILQIRESADYLSKMVNDLLDEAQAASKNMSLHMANFSPAALLQKLETSTEILARNKDLEFNTQLAPELPQLLYGDERRLQQILINLVGNAIKFTQTGKVDVKAYQSAPAQWALQVSDTGAGIPKEAQAYIFEPFRQVDNSITHENRGTGLGLSITKQLVELMGGEISLESELGQGSTFTVLLPILHKPENLHDTELVSENRLN